MNRLAIISALAFVAGVGGHQASGACRTPRELQDPAPVPRDDALEDGRAMLEDARAAAVAGDHVLARELVGNAVGSCFECGLSEREDEAAMKLMVELGYFAQEAGALREAERVRRAVVTIRERTLPAEHPHLLAARQSLALTLSSLGDHAAALVLEEQVLAARERALPANHLDLLAARMNLAGTVATLGDLARARSLLEAALASGEETLPKDHPHLLAVRQSLAATLGTLGELEDSRALLEAVLAARERSLPEGHPELLAAQENLAATLARLGDLAGGRALFEAVLAARERTLPEDHPQLLTARGNLAVTMYSSGDLAGARLLFEAMLESQEHTQPADHPDLLALRQNLAQTVAGLGDFARAHVLFKQVLDARERTLPTDHPHLLAARANLAVILFSRGEFASARALQEAVLAARERTLPGGHPETVRVRGNLALTISCQLRQESRAIGEGGGSDATEPEWEALARLYRELCRSELGAARLAVLTGSAREAEERAMGALWVLGNTLSAAQDPLAIELLEELVEEAFLLSEGLRGASLAVADLARCASGASEYKELRANLRRASAELAVLTEGGTSREEYHRARVRREEAERRLTRLARDRGGVASGWLELNLETLWERLGNHDALVAYRRYPAWTFELEAGEEDPTRELARLASTDSLCAFVLRKTGDERAPKLELIHLGPQSMLDQAVREWRGAITPETGKQGAPVGPGEPGSRGIGVERRALVNGRVQGEALRRLAWDPLLPALADARRVILVLDDILHSFPIDALPLDGDAGLVGDRWRIETRIALWELLGEPARGDASGAMLALGGSDFDGAPASPGEEGRVEQSPPTSVTTSRAKLLRGSTWEAGFTALEHTSLEVQGISELLAQLQVEGRVEEADSIVLSGQSASQAALEELAPRARWLHVATHGWFAPESVRSWEDLGSLGAGGLVPRLSSVEVVRGMSPMLLCGLALAGANLPADSLGRVPGLITAEELSTLDLSQCELAVLSACDTNVGERRAGQGVASLQKALHMAGARSVITSLWKVPDEATRELMLDFYRRLWLEKQPKSQALWEAKRRLREARDERGEPLYTTRDWAAWILTGEPD